MPHVVGPSDSHLGAAQPGNCQAVGHRKVHLMAAKRRENLQETSILSELKTTGDEDWGIPFLVVVHRFFIVKICSLSARV